jgi:hypothetical protein
LDYRGSRRAKQSSQMRINRLLCSILALGSFRQAITAEHAADHTARYCRSCERTASGRIRRSSAARRQFRNQNPCPTTGATTGPCPGFVIDHVKALKHGGTDEPGNMQWQSAAEAKAKDRRE